MKSSPIYLACIVPYPCVEHVFNTIHTHFMWHIETNTLNNHTVKVYPERVFLHICSKNQSMCFCIFRLPAFSSYANSIFVYKLRHRFAQNENKLKEIANPNRDCCWWAFHFVVYLCFQMKKVSNSTVRIKTTNKMG